eukprot:m51a1_g1213 putative trx2p (164) ;mRNA; r:482524-483228
MCYPVQCSKCGKTTWAGCGAHADMVMKRVPADQRCTCGSGPQKMEVDRAKAPTGGDPTGIRHANTFEEMKKEMASAGDRLIVVDFFATWCGPCKMMAPKFEALSKKYTNATFLKVNGDECPNCVETAGVSAFPTFQLYKGGKMVAEVLGVNEAGLKKAIEANL